MLQPIIDSNNPQMNESIWKLEWHDDLSVGIADIDQEHQGFITLINDLNEGVSNRASLSEIKRLMQLLIADAEQHFSHEEALFLEFNYPKATEHGLKHSEILHRYRELEKRLSSHTPEKEWIATGLEIKNILINHLLNEDMQYKILKTSSKHNSNSD